MGLRPILSQMGQFVFWHYFKRQMTAAATRVGGRAGEAAPVNGDWPVRHREATKGCAKENAAADPDRRIHPRHRGPKKLQDWPDTPQVRQKGSAQAVAHQASQSAPERYPSPRGRAPSRPKNWSSGAAKKGDEGTWSESMNSPSCCTTARDGKELSIADIRRPRVCQCHFSGFTQDKTRRPRGAAGKTPSPFIR